ncbi:MAG: hypothetical protein CEE38_13930 [Planctomycetes bacterium B3_Pla]|nr:MAG: hypothetical protein CEE38_13930 [Planctomycetes bacterium B3_Pla]
MAKQNKSDDDLKTITQLLQNLLAIELWRGGLSQAEIRERLGVRIGTVNKMLKGVSKEVPTVPAK